MSQTAVSPQKATAPERKTVYARRAVSVALCPPAVRCIVIEVDVIRADPRDSRIVEVDHRFYPVVALQSVVERVFAKNYTVGGGRYPSDGGTEEDLVKRLWTLMEQTTKTRALFAYPDGGLGTFDLEEEPDEHSFLQFVACPWPAEADAAQLASVVKLLTAKLKRRIEQAH